MMFSQSIIQKAISKQNDIVFPESSDGRILKAAASLLKQNIAKRVILLGDKQDILQNAIKLSINLNISHPSLHIIDPQNPKELTEKKDSYAQVLCERRKKKGMTLPQARSLLKNPLYLASMMVQQQDVGAMVAGAINTTADVLRATFCTIGASKNTSIVSSFFIMEYLDSTADKKKYKQILFADCAIVPRPSSKELAHIAVDTAHSCKTVLGLKPVVALLSFSTKGSAVHEETQKVSEAVKLAKTLDSKITIDGEIQFDAAFNMDIGKTKAPNSPITGLTNVYVFPDLNSGNIGYKIAQQLGKVKAYGPFIQGLAAPVSDLSRGCSVEDIVITSATMMCS